MDTQRDWIADCMKWRGKVLTGRFAHWCFDWDGLPIDETSREWPCPCAREMIREAIGKRVIAITAPFVGQRFNDTTYQALLAALQADAGLSALLALPGTHEGDRQQPGKDQPGAE
jgi:hypothetical protein